MLDVIKTDCDSGYYEEDAKNDKRKTTKSKNVRAMSGSVFHPYIIFRITGCESEYFQETDKTSWG